MYDYFFGDKYGRNKIKNEIKLERNLKINQIIAKNHLQNISWSVDCRLDEKDIDTQKA